MDQTMEGRGGGDAKHMGTYYSMIKTSSMARYEWNKLELSIITGH